MRRRLAVLLLSCLPLALSPACKRQAPSPSALGSSLPVRPRAPLPARDDGPARASSGAVMTFEKEVQERKLLPPARRGHVPQLAFGKGVLGQLTRDALLVYDSRDFRPLATEPLEAPRALIVLADGSLLAIGARMMLHWQRAMPRARVLAKPVLLPGVDLYADAQQADLIWTFDGESHGGISAVPAELSSYRLRPDVALLLPERTIALEAPRGGVFGVTREGVWLYCTTGRVERFSPGGLRLPGFVTTQAPLPTWMVPARRLDQSLWLDEQGHASRVLVSPSYKLLSSVQLAGPAVGVDVGDEGRLLAVVVVTGPGPRFELSLLDQNLAPRGRALLPSDAPTGAEDWVKVVSENQNVVVAPGEARVAVGGPRRVTIFDAQANQVFSIRSK